MMRCACCGVHLAAGDTVESRLYSPDKVHELCVDCAADERLWITMAWTNDLPKLLATYTHGANHDDPRSHP